MKKRFFFDLLALFAIAAGFFALFYFQDVDMGFLDNLKNSDAEVLVDKTTYESKEYTDKIVQDEVFKEELEKQIFLQPSEEELVNCYYYSKLNEEEKQIYKEIYAVLESMGKDVKLSTIDTVLLEKVFKCVLNDHPKFYYVEGYNYTTYTKGENVVKLEMTGKYSKTEEECKVIDAKIENYVAACFSGLDTAVSDYEKVKYIYKYIIENTEYNLASEDNQNICSVFINGESVCMGYAKAMQYLLLKQDILCTLVNGTANEGQEHAWNLLLLDDQYYHLDVTWGDDSYTVTNASDNKVGMTNYSFFCVTTEEILKTHTINSVVELPECIAWENNYYVKEGLYFSNADKEKLAGIFADAYEKEREYVEIKCADAVVYRQLYTYLIEEQHIFDYLQSGKDTVSYYDGEEMLLFEFWLK